MTEPKFSIGDRVAVCGHRIEDGKGEWLVVPCTSIVAVAPYRAGTLYFTRSGAWCHSDSYSGFLYEVDGYPDFGVKETSLRPIRPDEYDETPTTTERGISA